MTLILAPQVGGWVSAVQAATPYTNPGAAPLGQDAPREALGRVVVHLQQPRVLSATQARIAWRFVSGRDGLGKLWCERHISIILAFFNSPIHNYY